MSLLRWSLTSWPTWLLLLGSVSLAGIVPPAQADHFGDGVYRCDGGYCEDSQPRILDCEGGTCVGDVYGFTTVVNPAYDDGAWLDETDRVIGIEINGDARAYPVNIVYFFETVNETVGGVPLIVSYCPLCGSGVVYSRIVDGQELTFLNTGAIWKSDLVMFDLETGSEWTQLGGDVIRGPLHGSELQLIASQQVTWGAWKKAHPDTVAMMGPANELGEPYFDYTRDQARSATWRGQLTRLTEVHGVRLDVGAIAFPLPVLAQERVVEVTYERRHLVAAYAGGDVHVYHAGRHNFTQADAHEDRIVDDEGTTYEIITGKGDGGARLQRIAGKTSFWFAWHDFNKDTAVYTGIEAGVDQTPSAPREASGPPLAALLVVVVLALLVARARPSGGKRRA